LAEGGGVGDVEEFSAEFEVGALREGGLFGEG
jgi:hypothetical protein